MNYIIYSALFFSVILSGLTVLVFKISTRNLKLVLSFSGAYLFAISVLHLIPEIYSGGNKSIGIYILIGFFLQILLEFFSEGIEHGHIHIHKHSENIFPFTMMAGLCIHSFLEGMPLADMAADEKNTKNSLLIGIILHNIPIAIALMSMLLQSNMKKQLSIVLLVAFALMAPLGTFVSNIISDNMLGNISVFFDRIMGIVVGIFLHISTTILFESSENHRFNLLKFITILFGAGIAVITI